MVWLNCGLILCKLLMAYLLLIFVTKVLHMITIFWRGGAVGKNQLIDTFRTIT